MVLVYTIKLQQILQLDKYLNLQVLYKKTLVLYHFHWCMYLFQKLINEIKSFHAHYF